MPAFCRHNRLLQNCPICTREQGEEMNPVVTSSAPRISEGSGRGGSGAGGRGSDVSREKRSGGAAPAGRSGGRSGRGAGTGVRVRKLERGADDGYSSGLVQGLHSSVEAERLAEEIAFASTRLGVLVAATPPGLAAVADTSLDLEERTWAAVQFELDPDGHDDRVSWVSGAGADAYRGWAARAGSQQAAFVGESYWPAQRRFERIFERLGSVGGLDRAARYDLLVVLGRLGLYELEAGKLFPVGENETTWAAKRALGIGDLLLLERRAADLASACGVPLAALDLSFANWNAGVGARNGRGVPADLPPEPEVLAAVRGALEV